MATFHEPTNGRPRLVLLIDGEPSTRSIVGSLLESSGLELVQARDGVAGLEILQRLPDRFRLAIVSLELPGLSGSVVIETLRLFRSELPLICLATADAAGAAAQSGQCLTKPVRADALRTQLADALAGVVQSTSPATFTTEAISRARACYASGQSLLEAARELARGMSGEAA
jgi:CheY-like chemotaxis protein